MLVMPLLRLITPTKIGLILKLSLSNKFSQVCPVLAVLSMVLGLGVYIILHSHLTESNITFNLMKSIRHNFHFLILENWEGEGDEDSLQIGIPPNRNFFHLSIQSEF